VAISFYASKSPALCAVVEVMAILHEILDTMEYVFPRNVNNLKKINF